MSDAANIEERYSAEAIEAGRLLFARPVTFMKSAVSLDTLPPMGPPEVCFAGRSNVGKSSLINAVTNQKGLARASNTPGRTQELNYFSASDRAFLVDLPGYGFAKAPKAKVEAWTRLTRQFLRGRSTLRRVFVLIDARHGLKPIDADLMDMLDEAAVTYQIVLTKADKLKPPARRKVQAAVATAVAKRPAAYPEILLTSSEKSIGVAELRAEIAALALPEDAL